MLVRTPPTHPRGEGTVCRCLEAPPFGSWSDVLGTEVPDPPDELEAPFFPRASETPEGSQGVCARAKTAFLGAIFDDFLRGASIL